jgi:hypothetical protein
MQPCDDPVLFREIPVIRKIIQDETWLEGERRGCEVPPTDCVVRENVCRVILQVGQQIREAVARELPATSPISREMPQAIAERMNPSVFILTDGMDWEI